MTQLVLSVNTWFRFIAFLAFVTALGGPCSALSPKDAESGSYVYQVSRDGQIIGQLRQDFERDENRLTVITAADIEVTLFGISLYDADQRVEETWLDGKLQSVISSANVDGQDRAVTLRRQGDRMVGIYNGKERNLSAALIPTTLWNSSIIKAKALLDTSKGKTRKISVTDVGMENVHLPIGDVMAHHYSIDGEFRREVWFDEAGVLVVVQMLGKDGSTIRQELLQRP